MDSWLVEKIVLKYHSVDLLKAKLGATGETLYDLTEGYVVANWDMFSDGFRHTYRHELYEE